MISVKKLPLAILIASLAACGGSDNNDSTAEAQGTANVPSQDSPAPASPTGSSETADPAATPATPATETAESDQFLVTAYQDGLSEIQLPQLALERTSNDDVREFAQVMIEHHTAVNDQIRQLAQQENISLPTGLTAEQQAEVSRLQSLSGVEFDRAYMQLNVNVHQRDVVAAMAQASLSSTGTQTTNDSPLVKALAQANLPLLELHLAAAEEIYSVLDPAFFLGHAYQSGVMEIQLSQLALEKSSNPEVRAFAQRMIDDHTQVNNQISTLAQQKNIALPDSLPPAKQAAVDQLAKFNGTVFDKAYMQMNVVAHVKATSLFGEQAEEGQDEQVNQLAQNTEPALDTHLMSALDINNGIDPGFLYRAAQAINAEMALSNLALIRTSNSQVQTFAQNMFNEHARTKTQLMELAQQEDAVLPNHLAPEQLLALVRLIQMDDQDFDLAYVDSLIELQEQNVESFTAVAQRQDVDADIRAFAQTPVAQMNTQLSQARSISEQLKTSGSPPTAQPTEASQPAPQQASLNE